MSFFFLYVYIPLLRPLNDLWASPDSWLRRPAPLLFIYFLFYCPKHPQRYKSDSRHFLSCGSWRKYHVCLSPERIYSTDSLAGTPATAGGIRFFPYLFPSFFPPALRVVSQVIPGEKFLPPQRGPLRNEIIEGRKMRDRGQGGVIELLFILIWPHLSTLFVLTFNIGVGAKNKHVSGGIRQWSKLSDGAVKSVLTTFLPRSFPPSDLQRDVFTALHRGTENTQLFQGRQSRRIIQMDCPIYYNYRGANKQHKPQTTMSDLFQLII